MTLREYISHRNLSLVDSAKLFGCSEEGLKKWLRGARTPRPEQMRLIYKKTGGMVQPNDFILDSPFQVGA